MTSMQLICFLRDLKLYHITSSFMLFHTWVPTTCNFSFHEEFWFLPLFCYSTWLQRNLLLLGILYPLSTLIMQLIFFLGYLKHYHITSSFMLYYKCVPTTWIFLFMNSFDFPFPLSTHVCRGICYYWVICIHCLPWSRTTIIGEF